MPRKKKNPDAEKIAEDAIATEGVLPLADADLKDAGQRNRESAAARSRAISRAAKEIGELPPVADEHMRLKEQCVEDLELFLISMFREVWFPCTFGAQQKRYIEKARRTVREGGMHAVAMCRGWGKTMITIGTSMWAGLNGHRKYAVLFGATDPLAEKILNHIKAQGEKNPHLLAWYPEVFYPVRMLEGATQRCQSQTYDGVLTDIEWAKGHVTFPMIPGHPSAGYRIETVGITGTARGSTFAGMGGKSVRPDLIFMDDVQTKASAKSPGQTRDIIETIDQDIMGLVGPDDTLACLMACTVIKKGDQADQFLDQEKRPYWQGQRSGMLTNLPPNMKEWEEYNRVRIEGVVQGLGNGPGNAHYRKHQRVLDVGFESNWAEMWDRKNECSAKQRAMNKFFEMKKPGFMAEYMNDPEGGLTGQTKKLDPDDVSDRLSDVPRYMVPLECEILTAKIDVQKSLLWYAVGAFKEDFTGSVIDYGCMPDQPRRDFNFYELEKTLQGESGADEADLEAAIHWGLERLGELILDREWERDGDGAKFRITRCHIDIKDPAVSVAVNRFCRTSRWRNILLPTEGHAVGRGKLISQWTPKEGEKFPKPEKRKECEYRLSAPENGIRKLLFDKHFWIGRVVRALSLSVHASGSLTLYGSDPDEHMMISEHLASHYSETVMYGLIKRTVYLQQIGMRDDLLDCVSGCLQAASQEGCELLQPDVQEAIPAPGRNKKPRRRAHVSYL